MRNVSDTEPLPPLRWRDQFWFLWAMPLLWIASIHIATRIYWLTHPGVGQ